MAVEAIEGSTFVMSRPSLCACLLCLAVIAAPLAVFAAGVTGIAASSAHLRTEMASRTPASSR